MLHPGHTLAGVYQSLADTAQAEKRDVPRPASQEIIGDPRGLTDIMTLLTPRTSY